MNTYDSHEGEGNKEDGWEKCVVCQAFTIDPETERCIHWAKDVEHHEMWYEAPDPHAPAQHDSTAAELGLAQPTTCDHQWQHVFGNPDVRLNRCMKCDKYDLIDKRELATPPPAVPVPGAVFAVSDDDHYRDMHCAECGCTRRHFNIKGSSQWCCSMCKHLQTFPPLADQAEPKRVVLPFIVGQRVADISRSKRGIVTYVASGWLEYQDILTGETFAVENEYVSR